MAKRKEKTENPALHPEEGIIEEPIKGKGKKEPDPEAVYLVVSIGAQPMTVSFERFKNNADIYGRYIRVYPENE